MESASHKPIQVCIRAEEVAIYLLSGCGVSASISGGPSLLSG